MNHVTENNADAFVPGYWHHVFVSYSRADDHDGWVTQFSLKLQRLVNADLGHKSERIVFFDRPSIEPSAPLAKTLENAVQSSAIFVIVLSNAYLKSDWCRRERELFFESVGGAVPFPDGYDCRLFGLAQQQALSSRNQTRHFFWSRPPRNVAENFFSQRFPCCG